MKNQVLETYSSLNLQELLSIDGGCGGEDTNCPLYQILEALKHM